MRSKGASFELKGEDTNACMCILGLAFQKANHDIKRWAPPTATCIHSFPPQPLTCIHNLAHGYPSRAADFAELMLSTPPLRTPIVFQHPATGAPVLNVSESYTTRICELAETESEFLLAFLGDSDSRIPPFSIPREPLGPASQVLLWLFLQSPSD